MASRWNAVMATPMPRKAPAGIAAPVVQRSKTDDEDDNLALLGLAPQASGNAPLSWDTGVGPDPAMLNASSKEFKALQTDSLTPEEKAKDTALLDYQAYASGLGGEATTRELTTEEYNALNARQRAAVDANTALFNAVTADKQNAAGKKPDDTYNQTVSELFGEGGLSDTYAPQTVALLQQMGIKNTFGDLDSYLNLSAMVTEEDLAALGAETLSMQPLRDAEGRINPKTVRGYNALAFSDAALNGLSQALGSGLKLGQTDGMPSAGFDPLADQNSPDYRLNQLFETMAVGGLTEDELGQTITAFDEVYSIDSQTVFDYLEKRLQKYEADSTLGVRGATLGSDPSLQYLDPAAFRDRYYTGGK